MPIHRSRKTQRTKLVSAAASALIVAGPFNAFAQTTNTEPTHTIKVVFKNVAPEQERIWASLCTKDEYKGAGGNRCFMSARTDAVEGAEMFFESVPSGVYGIRAYHDTNGNERLDFNTRGIPDEPTGNSGNARGFFGPPKFGQLKFTLKDSEAGQEKVIVIKMMSFN